MKKIQIALVSKEALPVFYIINEFTPDIIYLLGTTETKYVTANIEQIAIQRGIECKKCNVIANDMADCRKVCEQIHQVNGSDCEYRYNLTCGNKLMAFGALLCAQTYNAKIVYTDTTTYVDIETMKHNPITRFLDTETIIEVQGQKVKEKTEYKYDALRSECAKEVKDFITIHRKAYNVLSSYYRKNEQIPRIFDTGNIHYERNSQGSITIEENDVEVFYSDYHEAFKMLFEGRWWETLIADAVYKWTGEGHDVWTNVMFNPTQQKVSENIKNEIDVLVNVDNILLFIECKSGGFTQDNIYKLKSVRETYGSYKSKGVIIAFNKNNVKPGFEEKAKENNIQIIVPNHNLSNLTSLLDKIIKSQNA